MRFYFISKQANHVEIRKTFIAKQDSTFFFFLPTRFGRTESYYDAKQNKTYSKMTMVSFNWLAWTFIRRTFKKRLRK